jgi:hypothetical protein
MKTQIIKDFLNIFFASTEEYEHSVRLYLGNFNNFFDKYFPEKNFSSSSNLEKLNVLKTFIKKYEDIFNIYGITVRGSNTVFYIYYNNKHVY